jgi:hypothetical protein
MENLLFGSFVAYIVAIQESRLDDNITRFTHLHSFINVNHMGQSFLMKDIFPATGVFMS